MRNLRAVTEAVTDAAPESGVQCVARELTPRVVIRSGALDRYYPLARQLYESMAYSILPAKEALPLGNTCPAILIGQVRGGNIVVEGMVPCRSVRHRGDAIGEEFGGVHADPTRGYLIDPRDILQIDRWARSIGCDIIGSIHCHADFWLKPEFSHIEMVADLVEQRIVVSEMPTKFDLELFRRTGWPLNLIYFLEVEDEIMCERISAWCARLGGAEGEYVQAPIVRECTHPLRRTAQFSPPRSTRSEV